MKIYGVVTGDIKNFTRLSDQKRGKLVSDTEHLLRSMVRQPMDAAIFRGDSYQFITDNISDILNKCIRLICWFKMNSDKHSVTRLGTRLSIGIGEIAYLGKNVLDSDGEAFHFSGRNFDKMDKEEIIRLTIFDEAKTNTYQVILMYINMIIKGWTINQAETIYQLLSIEDSTQEKIAKELKMSQPAVAKSLRAAKWKEVEKGISYINADLNKQYFA
ncbi:hypothetical protein [Mucilaginibacter sp. NFX135]|jgi:hypothetical protein|uniref:hypothetical protein n=1 Tax=Mucilaginibacter sp. NFX135 TaxID=3402687 RepID=UPI003AFB5EF7